ncbi:MAG TPA: PspC domain-containing protein [Chitinophagales bacterium]|nr:PspC domain-containing protein [Chitinophagales bacterium]HMZ94437.1 PspC domain-containing protein [Chitinophagales bacterium]HNC64757.1 PspC domain-containing protein [Chitinophagales bacterium]HND45402.1 PspC domain-containing protein [Chitinophagales bacterium]HNG26288.1 PspC domain-containing protein [Chitinophagales bacterium]
MLKTFNINLGGQAFVINEDAYHVLDNYLNNIKRIYANEEGKEEILQDIETRFAELFIQKGKDRIVAVEDVNQVIAVMGTPEDFEDGEQAETTTNTKPNFQKSTPTEKRLYRDKDNSVVAGVCSGLTAYFGINDPIWLRIIFIISPFITVGTALLVYIILWIIMPEAKTTAEKLAMKGEPINLSNIVEKKNEKIEELTSSSSLNNIVNAIGKIVSILFNILIKLSKVLLYIIFGSIILSLIGTVIAFIVSVFIGTPIAKQFLFDANTNSPILLILGGLLVGVSALVGLILLLVHLFSKNYKVFNLKTILPIVGLIISGLFILSFVTKEGAAFFKHKEKIVQSVPLNYSAMGDTLKLDISPMTKREHQININSFGDLMSFLGKDFEIENDVDIQIFTTPLDSFYVEKEFSSFGKTEKEALKNATSISHQLTQMNNKLIIDPLFSFNTKERKIRNQKLIVRVYVPENKVIQWTPQTEEYIDISDMPINWDKETYRKVNANNQVKIDIKSDSSNSVNINIRGNDNDDYDDDYDDRYDEQHYIFIAKNGEFIAID